MDVSMENMQQQQQQQQYHRGHEQTGQQQQQQGHLQHDAQMDHVADQSHAASAQLQRPADQAGQQQQYTQQQHVQQQQAQQIPDHQQQQQQQQQGQGRSSKGSKHRQRQEVEGPSVDKWWLSESEEEGDSDEEQRMIAQAEDPLYDPEADDADEAWAVQQRSGRTADAILSCPGCFTTLCIDCQQHEVYHTQYRAMFTQNCEVKMDEVVQTQVQRPQQQRSRKRRAEAAVPPSADTAEGDLLHPVCCAVCGTQVGAQDADEVVHFYQVLASEC